VVCLSHSGKEVGSKSKDRAHGGEEGGSWGGSEGSGGWPELLEVVCWTRAGVVWCQTVTALGMRLWPEG